MFRYFEHFPKESVCPICNTNKDTKCFLIPIQGTTDGNLCEAQVIHKNCFEKAIKTKLIINKSLHIIYFQY